MDEDNGLTGLVIGYLGLSAVVLRQECIAKSL